MTTNNSGLEEIFKYTWVIKNFSYYRGCFDEKLESSEFPDIEREDEIKWKLLLFPSAIPFADNQDYISLYLYLISCSVSQVQIINGKFCILNSRHEKSFSLEFSGPLKKFDTLGYCYYIRWDHLLCKDYDLFRDSLLKIYCEIKIAALSSESVNMQNNSAPLNGTISRDFGLLYESKKFCDVIFRIGDTEFKAHKAILSARSEVFSQYFEYNTEDNRFRVTDIDAQIFGEILRYIYTGETINLKTTAEKLLPVADKFKLDQLKFMCGREIGKTLTKETVAAILELADLHNAEDLKSQARNFMSNIHVANINEDVVIPPDENL